MSRLRLLAAALAVTGGLCVVPIAGANARPKHAAHRGPRVPQGFVGMNLTEPLYPPARDVNLAHQLDVMVSSGVESVRVAVDWATAQPYASWNDVPPAQRSQFVDVSSTPTRWGPLDQLVGLASARGLRILPTVLNAPVWDGKSGHGSSVAIPVSTYYYANFLTALVDRYGPNGTFWTKGSPRVPIEMWQIWNEPDLVGFWYEQPFEQSYVALLQSSYQAIKAADPKAQVVLAGFPNYSWGYLDRIYRIQGARQYFDVVAIHPYTRQPQGVITIARNVRQAMNTHGDVRKPMMITETGWTSSSGHTRRMYDFETTEAGQAQDLGQLVPLLAQNRARLRLLGFYWYNWADVEQPTGSAFSYSGLFRISRGQFTAKPVFGTFRQDALALEHCRAKGVRANLCRRAG